MTNTMKGICSALEEADAQIELLKKYKASLLFLLEDRYEDNIGIARNNKQYGVIHIDEAGYRLSHTIAKKVEWLQDDLTRAWAAIQYRGIDPAKYIKTIRDVSETVYKDAPTNIRSILDEARIEKPGTKTITVQKLEEEE